MEFGEEILFSGTRFIRTSRRHAIVSVLSECPYLASSQRRRDICFIDMKTKAHRFTRKRCLIYNCNSNKFTIIYHSLRVQCFKYSVFYSVIETGMTMGWFISEKVCNFTSLLCTDTFGLPTQSRGRKNLPLFNQGAIPTIIT